MQEYGDIESVNKDKEQDEAIDELYRMVEEQVEKHLKEIKLYKRIEFIIPTVILVVDFVIRIIDVYHNW